MALRPEDQPRARGRLRIPVRELGDAPDERIVRVARSHPEDRELTVYVKGFLTRGEKPDHFEVWHRSHRRLEEKLGWGPRVYGYCWPSGRIDGLPVPKIAPAHALLRTLRPARGARRLRAAGVVGFAMAEELAQVTAAFGYQYVQASRSARERADRLAERLRGLRRRYAHLRVVAHSLGCLHVVEAVAHLAADERPDTIHLCAPAFSEAEAGEKLSGLARDRSWLYFSRSDLVLRAGFPLVAGRRALGAVGPSAAYAGLTAVDVSPHFRFWVHLRYKALFAEFAGVEDRAARDF